MVKLENALYAQSMTVKIGVEDLNQVNTKIKIVKSQAQKKKSRGAYLMLNIPDLKIIDTETNICIGCLLWFRLEANAESREK